MGFTADVYLVNHLPAPPPAFSPPPQVATYVGFTAEVYAWFVIGEIIGRGGSLTGYSL